MLKIIQKWLVNSLGIVIDMDKETFARKAKDGILVSQILRSYHILTDEQLDLIKPDTSISVAYANFKNHICYWLSSIGIELDEVDLVEIVGEKGTAALNLFYELYLTLEDKSRLHFIAEERKRERLRPKSEKFNVSLVKESILDNFKVPDDSLCEPLVENLDIIRWHKERLENLTRQCQEARQNYLEYLSSKGKPQIVVPGKPCTCECPCNCLMDSKIEELPFCGSLQDLTYKELIDLQEEAKKKDFRPDPREAKRVINELRHKVNKGAERNIMKLQLQNELVDNVWKTLESDQERQFDRLISHKMLVQSYFEKQMITKLFVVKQNKETIIENRQFINEQIMEQKENDIQNEGIICDKNVNDAKQNYYFEKQRILELHSRLYAEKLRLKAERIRKMCEDAVKDIINLALRCYEYIEVYDQQPDRRTWGNWATLFVHSQPIFPRVQPTEEIIQDLSDLPKNIEQDFIEEIERQNVMDQDDFNRYSKYEWPWNLDEAACPPEDLKLIESGMNIVGYIVHRALLVKYPLPPPIPRPDFKFTNCVCLNGLTDVNVLPQLQKLLKKSNLKLIELHDATNYCLECYKKETKIEYTDEETTPPTSPKRGGRNNGSQNKKLQKGKKENNHSPPHKSPPEEKAGTPSKLENKKSQTPIIFPCEEISLSEAAHLGQIAESQLTIGETLTDYLLTAMFNEYLQTLGEYSGWVLINYPSDIHQAACLEETLNATKIASQVNFMDFKSIVDIADLKMRMDDEEDSVCTKEKREMRKSRIVPNTIAPKEQKNIETFLSAVIRMEKSLTDVNLDDETTHPALKLLDENVTNPMERFYIDQGCYYYFFYDTLDFESLKKLARMIIGDYSLPPKPSMELFGLAALYHNAEDDERPSSSPKSAKGSMKTKSKKKLHLPKKSPSPPKKEEGEGNHNHNHKKNEVPEGKEGKGGKGGISPRKSVETETKETQAPELEEVYDITYFEEGEEEAKPGEEKWVYLEIPLPNNYMKVLANLWESAEEIYVEDLKQVFFMRRVILNTMVPYISYIKNHMKQYIERPDYRQNYLHEFQYNYNNMSVDLRSDEEVKAEWHCRIDELRQLLWDISDQKMKESMEERERLLSQNWVLKQVCELYNVFTLAFQIELDRLVDTYHLLTDYYLFAMTGKPCEENIFTKDNIRQGEVDQYSSLSLTLSTPEYYFDIQVFHDMIEEKRKKTISLMDKKKAAVYKYITAMDGNILSKTAKEVKKKGSPSKGALNVGYTPSELVKENYFKLLEEWKVAVNAELKRAVLASMLIANDACSRFDEIVQRVSKAATEIFTDIKTRYQNEVNSVKDMCDVLMCALESEKTIQLELVLDGDEFYVRPDILLYRDPEPVYEETDKEWKASGVFMIQQLRQLFKVFKQLAPSGIIPEQIFLYILQDYIAWDPEDGKDLVMPAVWRKMTSLEINKFSRKIFGDTEFIPWKDFILLNLILFFPNEDELLEVRREFRKFDPQCTEAVCKDDYYQIEFWFEKYFNSEKPLEVNRLGLIKDLLFDMYKLNDDRVNYSALLLDFCKDESYMLGFTKALELSLGKKICWESYVGMNFVSRELAKREAHENSVRRRNLEIEKNKQMATEIIDTVIDKTVHQCDSVYIYELQSEKSETVTPSDQDLSQHGESSFGAPSYDDEAEDGVYIDYHPEEQSFTSDEFGSSSLDMEQRFSNVEIGFEPADSPPLVYILPYDLVLTVLSAALPWHTQVQNLEALSLREKVEKIYKSCENPSFDNCVLAHEFLNDPRIQQLIKRVRRFTDINPVKLVYSILKEKV